VNNSLIKEVKNKRELSMLPNSIIQNALDLNQQDVKITRAFLRKYFGVFLTNKVLKLKYEKILKSHISSKKRDYLQLYSLIHSVIGGEVKSIIVLGCGANGFSYPFILGEFGEVSYIGLEAVGQIVSNTNTFFQENNFKEAKVVQTDIFDLEKIKQSISKMPSRRVIFLFQVIDALESIEKNFSKKLLLEIRSILSFNDTLIISNSKKSISGRSNFLSKRDWLKNFLSENFQIINEFSLFDEDMIIFKKK